ncbi:hypothetical protein GMLC_16760 [Geomonas limicola]|uniref:histidine kinase n=1 Tax=Geomonas limicola TaxID=2740186 RepID=A0A6V8N8K2_9BACT|nr:PAS domain S-box protein [Geomonas limicola]GFO68097.1 hypothetical protein GMLC_16760 [Geomonas limicola]
MDEDVVNLLLQVAVEGFWDWNLETDLAYLSPRFCELTGYQSDETVFNSAFFASIIHPEDRESVLTKLRENLKSSQDESTLEYRMISKDSGLRWIEGRGVIVKRDERGKPLRIIGTIVDISHKKQAEKDLQEAKQLYETLFRLSPEILTLTSEDGRYLAVNSAHDVATGYCSEELLGRSWAQTGIWPDANQRRQTIEMLDSAGIVHNAEVTFCRKSGESFPALLSMARVDIGGKPCVVSVVRDITARKQMEQQLRTSEEWFRSIMALSPDVISLLDEHGVLVYNSPAAFAIHGYVEELEGRNTFELIHPDDRAAVGAAFETLINNPAEFTPVQYRYLNKDGSYVWMEATGSNQLRNPLIKGIVAISRDISERKEIEEQRLKLERHLLQAQKLESLGILAGGIAHDFNNILTGIMGNISFAKLYMDPSEKAQELLDRAEKATQRAADLSRQLVVFAKGGKPVKRVMSLQRAVGDALALTLTGTSVKGVTEIEEELFAVEADEGQISQALHNIIINAVHAMPGGGRLVVQGENVTLKSPNVTGLAAGSYVKLCFIDEGCGISPDDQERIFDPYFTTKAKRSGLGLASSYAIVTNHGGHITVSSTPGAGSTFTLYLSALPRTFSEGEERPNGSFGCGRELNVLVMDDEEVVRDLVRIALEHSGHKVETCNDGEEAISIYAAAMEAGNRFDVVIMDLTVPGGMGGSEGARHILSIDPEAKLIVSSGYSEDPVISNYSVYGFCAAIEKPYKADELASRLERVLVSPR